MKAKGDFVVAHIYLSIEVGIPQMMFFFEISAGYRAASDGGVKAHTTLAMSSTERAPVSMAFAGYLSGR